MDRLSIDRRRHGRRARRQVATVATSALAAGVVSILVAIAFVMFPTEDRLPRHADVAFVLGPPTPVRVAEAYRLQEAGRADDVLISLARDSVSVPYWKRICSQDGTVCRVANPYTTQGEARDLRDLSADRGWTSAVVITQTSHITRARMVLSRCFGDAIAMRASGEAPRNGWPYELAYQIAATAKALVVDPTC